MQFHSAMHLHHNKFFNHFNQQIAYEVFDTENSRGRESKHFHPSSAWQHRTFNSDPLRLRAQKFYMVNCQNKMLAENDSELLSCMPRARHSLAIGQRKLNMQLIIIFLSIYDFQTYFQAYLVTQLLLHYEFFYLAEQRKSERFT